MSYSFEGKNKLSPQFDLSTGRVYTEDDFIQLSFGPDEPIVTAKKMELLDLAIRNGKEMKATFVSGKVIQGKFSEYGALAGDYKCGDETVHLGEIQDIQSIEIL